MYDYLLVVAMTAPVITAMIMSTWRHVSRKATMAAWVLFAICMSAALAIAVSTKIINANAWANEPYYAEMVLMIAFIVVWTNVMAVLWGTQPREHIITPNTKPILTERQRRKAVRAAMRL